MADSRSDGHLSKKVRTRKRDDDAESGAKLSYSAAVSRSLQRLVEEEAPPWLEEDYIEVTASSATGSELNGNRKDRLRSLTSTLIISWSSLWRKMTLIMLLWMAPRVFLDIPCPSNSGGPTSDPPKHTQRMNGMIPLQCPASIEKQLCPGQSTLPPPTMNNGNRYSARPLMLQRDVTISVHQPAKQYTHKRAAKGMGLRLNLTELMASGLQAASSCAGPKRHPRARIKAKSRTGPQALTSSSNPERWPQCGRPRGTLEIQLAPTTTAQHLGINISSHTEMICDCPVVVSTGVSTEGNHSSQADPVLGFAPTRDSGPVTVLLPTDPPDPLPEASALAIDEAQGMDIPNNGEAEWAESSLGLGSWLSFDRSFRIGHGLGIP
ncbi:hypothetical protein K2173_013453 [Erythroxylum novogranatense]|uniref:Uncharacterized protein n=1 Tax=Erythroxylum novogranatense TaxID=1862640 RepID=A0AAV8SAI0_9ROSI|nr:hypothetical protein K2173_013453 [Erythroxylum novogranatense]